MTMDPREELLPMVKSRSQVGAWLRGAIRFVPHLALIIASALVPRFNPRTLARATPRFWPYAKALLTVIGAFTWASQVRGRGTGLALSQVVAGLARLHHRHASAFLASFARKPLRST